MNILTFFIAVLMFDCNSLSKIKKVQNSDTQLHPPPIKKPHNNLQISNCVRETYVTMGFSTQNRQQDQRPMVYNLHWEAQIWGQDTLIFLLSDRSMEQSSKPSGWSTNARSIWEKPKSYWRGHQQLYEFRTKFSKK